MKNDAHVSAGEKRPSTAGNGHSVVLPYLLCVARVCSAQLGPCRRIARPNRLAWQRLTSLYAAYILPSLTIENFI
jgi:hypothetical protein